MKVFVRLDEDSDSWIDPKSIAALIDRAGDTEILFVGNATPLTIRGVTPSALLDKARAWIETVP